MDGIFCGKAQLMVFLPLSVIFFIVLIILFPLLFILVQVGILHVAFGRLGLHPVAGFGIFLLSLMGSTINIPL